MITETTASTALQTAFSLGLLWGLAWLYRKHRVDVFRHEIFVLRAELFDLARGGEIAFDHPAYVGMRTTLNGFLRYAERIGFTQTFLANRALKKVSKASNIFWWDRQWEIAVAKVAPGPRAELIAIRERMHYALFQHLVRSSPLMLATIIPFVLFAILEHAGKQLVWRWASEMYKWFETRFEEAISRPLDALAYRVGAT